MTPELCVFGEDEVRIERGPQRVEVPCTDKNLQRMRTKYRIGGRDGSGRLIRPEELKVALEAQRDAETDQGERDKLTVRIANLRADMAREEVIGRAFVEKDQPMQIVDWKQEHMPWVWYVYEKDRVGRFQLVTHVRDKNSAIEKAREIMRRKG